MLCCWARFYFCKYVSQLFVFYAHLSQLDPPLFPNPFILHSLTRIQSIPPFTTKSPPPLLFSSSPNSGRFFSLTASRARHSSERGKAGGHEPPLFPLQGHILAFFLPAAMSHHYFLFRATTFDSSRQNYFFE